MNGSKAAFGEARRLLVTEPVPPPGRRNWPKNVLGVSGVGDGETMNKHIQQLDMDIAVRTVVQPHPATTFGPPYSAPAAFRIAKRSFDILVSLAAMPLILGAGIIILAINPLWNAGPLFFMQTRMGRDCRPFRAIKFRTMRPASEIVRGPNDPLEADRITPLGQLLRVSRVDELPQFLNVLIGHMSLIGPRPDFWDHATHYLDSIPGYRQRHVVRPGITGLAQVDGGYAEGVDATVEKTRHDLRYIRASGVAMECYVLWRTIYVVCTGSGAR